MNFSQFELDVIEALIKGEPEEKIIQSQLQEAIVKDREYTGVGLYATIQVTENCTRISKSNKYIEETPLVHLEHPDLSAGAGAMLWFDNGNVLTLECYTYDDAWSEDETKFRIIKNKIEYD